MRRRIRNILARCVPVGLAILLATPPLPRAQQGTDADPLVAQVLMASTYPLEVNQAARFAKNNPNLKDAALDEELKKQNWDDSVKSLVSFPQILEMMNDQVEWMQKLGDAFLGQQKETMDAIQRLRAKAHAAGNLKSNEQQKVIVEQAQGEPIYDFVVNGHMIGGFALVAYPAMYGVLGFMTFIVSHDGVVYQKDLGRRTA
jgi:hypothetical protein